MKQQQPQQQRGAPAPPPAYPPGTGGYAAPAQYYAAPGAPSGADGLPLSLAAVQPAYSMTGGGGAPGYMAGPGPYMYEPPGAAGYAQPWPAGGGGGGAGGGGGVPGSGFWAPAAGGGAGAPLLVPAPPHPRGGGAPAAGFSPGWGPPPPPPPQAPGGAAGEPWGMGADVMYASRAVRHGFMRKVLGILAAQLALTAAVAGPVALAPAPAAWLAANAWALPLALIVTFSSLIALACSEQARRSHPWNLLLLAAFSAAQGLLVGVACAAYSTPTVLEAVVITAAVCGALAVYALQTKYDFTAAGGMLYSAMTVLLLVMIGNSFLHLPAVDLLAAGSGALLFCCYLVYDVQLLVSGDHSVAVSVDEPVMAALNIYVDLINIFLYILRLLGRDDD